MNRLWYLIRRNLRTWCVAYLLTLAVLWLICLVA